MTTFGDLCLSLGADSLWLQDEASGTVIADTGPANKDLTLTGSGYALQDDTGFTGVGDGIDYGGAAYSLIASALTQVVTDQMSFVGFFYDNANPGDFSQPWFCASFSGGHVEPFYTFGLFKNSSGEYRIALDTGGAFSPVDTGVAIVATGAWHMFALVYNGATIKLYVDGSQVFSTARTGNVGDMGSFAIADIPALGAGFSPDIRSSNAAYWSDYALTAGDVSDLWDARNAPGCNPPINAGGTSSPSISGTAEVGETLTANPGSWSGDPTITFAYQWYRLCGTLETLLVGETAVTYVVQSDDIGCDLFVEVTASNGCAPDGVADSDAVGPVPDSPPVNTVAPVVSGVPFPGHLLETTDGTWVGTEPITFAYQWQMDCSSGFISLMGETSSTLLLTDEMVGCLIRCVVTATNSEGSTVANSNSVEVQANVPASVEICEGPQWRFVVASLDCEIITYLDRLARNRTVTYVLNQAAVATGLVPSDDPRVNILHTDGDPYLSEGNRLLFGFRNEQVGPSMAWVIRYAGIVLQLEDAAESDNSDTSYTAYDPWQYLRSRPVRNGPDFEYTLPGLNGSSYTATKINVIALEILRNTIVTDGPVFIDAGPLYGGTGFYGGTIEDCEQIDINFAQGMSVGDAWDELVSGNQADFVLTPIYDPERRPGYTHELSIFTQAGSIRDAAVFGWNKVPRNLIGVSRLIEGSGRANNVKYFAGQGGTAVGGQAIPVQVDSDSVTKYGAYWAQTFFPGQNVPAAVLALAQAELEIRKNGRITVSVSPSPDCATDLFGGFFLGDRVPEYASNALRATLTGYQRIYGIPVSIADDSTETIERMLCSKEGVS